MSADSLEGVWASGEAAPPSPFVGAGEDGPLSPEAALLEGFTGAFEEEPPANSSFGPIAAEHGPFVTPQPASHLPPELTATDEWFDGVAPPRSYETAEDVVNAEAFVPSMQPTATPLLEAAAPEVLPLETDAGSVGEHGLAETDRANIYEDVLIQEEEEEEEDSAARLPQGVSPLAVQAAKQWNAQDRPKAWQGRVYGLVVHTTGGGLPAKARDRGVYHTVQAVEHYNRSHGCHYVNGWRGVAGGDFLQVANEREQASGVGVTNSKDPSIDQRRSIDRGRFEKDLPVDLVARWRARWPGYRHSLELLPGTRNANSCYVHMECVPCVFFYDGKLITAAEPLRPGLRFTRAQHETVALAACDIARRNGWPLDERWWRTPRLLGHEDLTPISRHTSSGGWDPGYLRKEPYFDWDYVYQAIERLQRSGATAGPVGSAGERAPAVLADQLRPDHRSDGPRPGENVDEAVSGDLEAALPDLVAHVGELGLGEGAQKQSNKIAATQFLFEEAEGLFDRAREAYRDAIDAIKTRNRIDRGILKERLLITAVFNDRYPSRAGQTPSPTEWEYIRNRIVRPALFSHPRPRIPAAPGSKAMVGVFGQKPEGYLSVPVADMVPGIDVSHHQGTIDWARVAAAGVRFAYMKCTEGATWQDPHFAANWAGGLANGIPRGAYHLLKRPSLSTAAAQVRNFLTNVTLQAGDLPPCLDVEYRDLTQIINDMGVVHAWRHIWDWCEGVENATGYQPLLYVSKRGVEELKGNVGSLPALELWMPRYRNVNNPPPLPEDSAGNLIFPHWSFWQHSETGNVAGISGRVDLNLFNGNAQNFVEWMRNVRPHP